MAKKPRIPPAPTERLEIAQDTFAMILSAANLGCDCRTCRIGKKVAEKLLSEYGE